MDKKIYFQIIVETNPFIVDECGKFTIFLSTDYNGLVPVECDDEIENLLGCELMEGIWAVNSINECDTVDGITKILKSHGFVESHNLNKEENEK